MIIYHELKFSMCILGSGALVLLLAAFDGSAQAQSSLFRPVPLNAMSVSQFAPIHSPSPRPYQVHDLVAVVIDEQFLQDINARSNRRKQREFEISFEDAMVLEPGFNLRADDGIREDQPGFDIEAENTIRNILQFNNRQRLQYTLMAEVAEVKPNGNLVLEGHKTSSVNNEISTITISGIVRPEDIDPQTRSIQGSRIYSLVAEVSSIGPSRDAIKRGWLTRLIDAFGPF